MKKRLFSGIVSLEQGINISLQVVSIAIWLIRLEWDEYRYEDAIEYVS